MFVDTSGLLCLFDRRDFRHERAHDLIDKAPILISHSYVLAEFIPLTHSRGLSRLAALEFANDILNSQLVELIWVDERFASRSAGTI